MNRNKSQIHTIEQWNTRPIEDELQAHIDELQFKDDAPLKSYLTDEDADELLRLVKKMVDMQARIDELTKENERLNKQVDMLSEEIYGEWRDEETQW